MIKIGPWLSEGWNLFSKHFANFALAAFLAVLGAVCTCSILMIPLMFGISYMAMRALRGQTFSVGDLGFGFQRFGKAMLLWIICIGVSVVAGGAAGVHQGFSSLINLVVSPFLTMLIMLAGFQIVDRDEEFGKAVSNVFDLFKKDWLMFWVCGLVFGILQSIGAVACIVGVFVTMPWIACAGAVAYRDLFGLATPKEQMASEPAAPPPSEPTPS